MGGGGNWQDVIGRGGACRHQGIVDHLGTQSGMGRQESQQVIGVFI